MTTEYTAEIGAYVYTLCAVNEHWIVRRRPVDQPNIPPYWQVATDDDDEWGSWIAKATPRQFADVAAARLFVVHIVMWDRSGMMVG